MFVNPPHSRRQETVLFRQNQPLGHMSTVIGRFSDSLSRMTSCNSAIVAVAARPSNKPAQKTCCSSVTRTLSLVPIKSTTDGRVSRYPCAIKALSGLSAIPPISSVELDHSYEDARAKGAEYAIGMC